jgi:hypothetical protein
MPSEISGRREMETADDELKAQNIAKKFLKPKQ